MTYMVQLLPMIYVVAINLLELFTFHNDYVFKFNGINCTPRLSPHVLAVDSICKPLHEFCEIISPQLNIHVDFFEPNNELSLKSLFKGNLQN